MNKNGCKYFNDCFTCPFDDCVNEVGVKNRRAIKSGEWGNKARKPVPAEKIDLDSDDKKVRNYSRAMLKYYERREQHLCVFCGNKIPDDVDSVRCEKCAEKQRNKYERKRK